MLPLVEKIIPGDTIASRDLEDQTDKASIFLTMQDDLLWF